MKKLDLVCNTMILTGFIMKMIRKVKPQKRSDVYVPAYAIVSPFYIQGKLREGIILGYADDEESADWMSRTTPIRSVTISLDVQPGVLGYTKIISIYDWCSPNAMPASIRKWINEHNAEKTVISRIAGILNGKLKRK